MTQYKVTRYFFEQVLRKRPYLTLDVCIAVIVTPLQRDVQPDGRIRHWGKFSLPEDSKTRALRVITLNDGITLHNAFLDRDFMMEDI